MLALAGVDVGKSFLDLGFDPAAKPPRFRHDGPGIAALIATLRRRGATHVALEAIGPYAYALADAPVAAGFEAFVADPRQIRAFRAAEGLIAKTDRLDAGLIARFARRMPERLRPAPDPGQVALKALSSRRRQLTELIAMEKTRLAQAIDTDIAASHRVVIAAARADVERELDRRIDAEAALARRREILDAIPGIARRIATLVVTDMPALGPLDREAAASLAGMARRHCRSDQWRDHGDPDQGGPTPGRNAIAGGRPCLRSAF